MFDLWSLVAGGPLAMWLGYVHVTRPSRNECVLKHKLEAQVMATIRAEMQGLGDRLEERLGMVLAKTGAIETAVHNQNSLIGRLLIEREARHETSPHHSG